MLYDIMAGEILDNGYVLNKNELLQVLTGEILDNSQVLSFAKLLSQKKSLSGHLIAYKPTDLIKEEFNNNSLQICIVYLERTAYRARVTEYVCSVAESLAVTISTIPIRIETNSKSDRSS